MGTFAVSRESGFCDNPLEYGTAFSYLSAITPR